MGCKPGKEAAAPPTKAPGKGKPKEDPSEESSEESEYEEESAAATSPQESGTQELKGKSSMTASDAGTVESMPSGAVQPAAVSTAPPKGTGSPQGQPPAERFPITTPPAMSPEVRVDPTDFMTTQPDGVYLVYDQPDHGTFFAKYSKTPVPGALAYARRGDYFNIPEFKYKQMKSVLTRTHLGRKNFYQGWCLWMKEARLLEGVFVILPAYEDRMQEDTQKFPAFRMFLLQGTKVVEVFWGPKSKPQNLRFTDTLALVPPTYTGFDDTIKRKTPLERSEFISKVKVPQDYAYIEFN